MDDLLFHNGSAALRWTKPLRADAARQEGRLTEMDNFKARGITLKKLLLAGALLLTSCVGIGLSQEGSKGNGPQKSKVHPEVWRKVQEKGIVHVIVRLDMPWQSEDKLSKSEITAQQKAIADAQKRLLAELAGTKYKLKGLAPMSPLLSLEVDPYALAILENSILVLRVSENVVGQHGLLRSVPLVGVGQSTTSSFDGTRLLRSRRWPLSSHPAIVSGYCGLGSNLWVAPAQTERMAAALPECRRDLPKIAIEMKNLGQSKTITHCDDEIKVSSFPDFVNLTVGGSENPCKVQVKCVSRTRPVTGGHKGREPVALRATAHPPPR